MVHSLKLCQKQIFNLIYLNRQIRNIFLKQLILNVRIMLCGMCSFQNKMKMQQVKDLRTNKILLFCCSLNHKNTHHYFLLQYFRHSTSYTSALMGKIKNCLSIISLSKESTNVVMPACYKFTISSELLHPASAQLLLHQGKYTSLCQTLKLK